MYSTGPILNKKNTTFPVGIWHRCRVLTCNTACFVSVFQNTITLSSWLQIFLKKRADFYVLLLKWGLRQWMLHVKTSAPLIIYCTTCLCNTAWKGVTHFDETNSYAHHCLKCFSEVKRKLCIWWNCGCKKQVKNACLSNVSNTKHTLYSIQEKQDYYD